MSNLKRMPHHRVIYLSSHVQGWSSDYRIRVANLSTALTNYKNSLSGNLVKPHKTLEVGGHKASQIKSYVVDNIKTAEDFCSEIRSARGEFGSLHERLSNITGSGFIKSWASSSEFNATESKQNVRVSNSRLECAEEPKPHQDIFGLTNLIFKSPSSGNYDLVARANDSSTYLSGLASTVVQDPFQIQNTEKVFKIGSGVTYYLNQSQSPSESAFFYINYMPTAVSTNAYVAVKDQNSFIDFYLSTDGITVNKKPYNGDPFVTDGIFYSYDSIIPGRTTGDKYYKLTIVKVKNYFWEMYLDNVLVHRRSYLYGSWSNYQGVIYPTFDATPLIGVFANSPPALIISPGGYLYLKEFAATQFSTSSSVYENIKFNDNNSFTLEPGKLNGSYLSDIRNIYKDRGSNAKKITSVYTGPKPRTYVRFAETPLLIKNKNWEQVLDPGDIKTITRNTPYCQFKIDISGSGSSQSNGSSLLLSSSKNFKVTTSCVGGIPIADSGSNISAPFTNDINNVLFQSLGNSSINYWSGSNNGQSIINSWIGYNFLSPKKIKTIILSQAFVYAGNLLGFNWVSSIKIQKSSNGTNWEDVQTVSIVQDSSIRLINVVDTAEAQYWRVKANSGPLRSSNNVGWSLSLLQMFEESFISAETLNYTSVADKISFQGNTLTTIPNGDLSNGGTGWVYSTEISNPYDSTKIAVLSQSSYYTSGISTSLNTPSFILKGPVEFSYKISTSGDRDQRTKMYVYDSQTNSLLDERNLPANTYWTICQYFPPSSILNKNVYIKFYQGAGYIFSANLSVSFGVAYIKTLDAKYLSIPKKIEGNKIKKIKWKQKVGSGEPIQDNSVYPNIILKTGTTQTEAVSSSESLLPSQPTLSGVWTECSVSLEQLGSYVALGAYFGSPNAHNYLIELKDFEVEWEKITVTDATTVNTVTFDYDSYLYYQNGEAYYRFDSNDKSTKWGRFMAEGGFEATATNANTKWEKRVLKNVTDAYVGIDAFSKSMVELVTSPSANSNFSVSGNGSNAAYLFTTYLYNGTSLDITLSIPVSSSGSNNIWEIFKNRQSLGLKKSSYNLFIPAGAWARVDLYFKRVGTSSESFYTNINWPASVSIMNSTQNMNPDPDMFAMRVSDTWPIPDSEPWIPTGNNTAIDLQGRYFNVKVKTRASADRMKSTGTSFFAVSYTGDASSKVVTNIASLAENLARTNFELKVLTQADSKNLLHIFQDVFENQSDISTYSSNIVRDSALPGIKQINSSQPGTLLSTMFENKYYPTFAMVVADGIGEIEYFVSRDNGVTFSLMKPSTLTEFSGKLGKQIVFKAVLKNGAVLKRWAVIL